MRVQRLLGIFGVCLATGSSTVLSAPKSAEDLRVTFASFRTAEFPREVARMIAREKGAQAEEGSLDILRNAIIYNPPAAIATVGAASRVAPDLAVHFAATAALILPELAPGIARATAAAAPVRASEIAAAVTKEHPAQFARIAYEVSYAVPGQDEKIVNAIITSLPNLKAFTGAAPKTSLSVAPDCTAVGTSTPVPVSASAAITDLVATAPLVESTAHELGMKTDQLLVAELTPAQSAAVATKVQEVKAGKVSALGVTRGVAFTPGAGTPGAANRAQPVTVTPGQGRSYENPGQGPK
jgi:hypothetical protein